MVSILLIGQYLYSHWVLGVCPGGIESYRLPPFWALSPMIMGMWEILLWLLLFITHAVWPFVQSLNLLYFLSSTKGWLDTKTRWPMHVQQHLSQWQSPLFLLSKGPPNHAWLVQGHGSYYLGTWIMARGGGGLHAQCLDFNCLLKQTDCCCQCILFN